MRVNARWFKPERERSATEIADAVAFTAFRVARNTERRLRNAGFEVPVGAARFSVLAEVLVFLVVSADRIAQRRGDEAWRLQFTTALANRAGAILADNEAELLGNGSRPIFKERFIALVNGCADEYARCGWNDGPDYDFLRCAGHRVGDVLLAEERTWTVAQVIDIEAPEAIGTLQRAMRELLDTMPREARGRGAADGE